MNHFSEIIQAFDEQNPDFFIEENPEAEVLRRMLREQREIIEKMKQQEKERVEKILSQDYDHVDDMKAEIRRIFKLEE